MEFSLHADLKRLFAGDAARAEVRVGRYRIDAVVDEWLIEVQRSSLASLRDKVRRLLEDHSVRIVKPIVAKKTLVRFDAAGGRELRRRTSPKRGGWLELFDELVYCTRLFPHPRLELVAVLVEAEEWRVPGFGRRRYRDGRDYVVHDVRLTSVGETRTLRTGDDLWALLPRRPRGSFDTAQLAEAAAIPRYRAQRVAYCLRKMGSLDLIGKRGNAQLYRRARRRVA